MSEWNIKIGTTLDTSDAKKKLDSLISEYSNSDKAKINVGINIKGEEKVNNLKGSLKEIKNLAKSIGTVKIDVSSSLGNISADSIKQIETSTQQLQSATQEISKHLTDGIEKSVKATTSSLNAELKGITKQVNTMLKAFESIDLELLDPNQQRAVEMTIAKLETLKGQNIKAFDTFQLKQAESTIKETLKTFEEMTNVTGKKMFQTNYVDGFIHKMETVKTVMEGMGIATDNIELLINKAKGLYESSKYVDNMRVAYQSLNKELREQVTKPFQLTGITSDEMGLDKLIKYRDELTKKIYDSKPGTDMSKTIQQLAVVENAIDKIKTQLNNVGTETAKALDMKSLANQAEMAGNAMAKSAKEQEKYQKQLQKEYGNSTKRLEELRTKAQSLDMTSGVDVSKWRAVNEMVNSITQEIEKLGDTEVTADWINNLNSKLDTLENNVNDIEEEAQRLNLEEKFDIDASRAESAINGIHASLVQLGRDTSKVDEFKTKFDSLKDLAKTDLGQASSGLNRLMQDMKDFGKQNNLGDIAGTMKQLEGYVKDFNNAVSKSMSAKDLNLAEKFEDEARRSADAIRLLLNSIEGIDDEVKSSFERMTSAVDSSDFSKQLQNIITDVNRYKAVMQNINQNIKFDGLTSDVGQGLAQEFNQAIAKAHELENALQNMLKSGQFDLSEFNRLKSELEDAKARVASFSSESIIIRCDEAITNLKQLRSEMEAIGEDTSGIDDTIASFERLGNAVKDSAISVKDAMSEMKSATREADNISKSFDKTIKSMDDMGSSVRNAFSSISDAFSSVSLGMMIEEGIETMVYSIKDVIFELDSALTEFARVAPDDFAINDASLQQVTKSAREMAISVGQSVEDVIVGMSTALQAGATTMEQASAIAEKSAILQNVSDMDSKSASQAISSMITQYYSMDTALSQVSTGAGKAVQGYNNLTQAIDMVNYAGNNFAISSQGVTEALQDGGSTLSAYGVTLSDSIALISGANESLQDPSRVGNGLKSIAVNLAGLKTSAKDGTIELNKTAMGLQQIAGIDIFTDSSKTSVKDMMTLMDELNGKWGELTEAEQLALSEGIAGNIQDFCLIILMTNNKYSCII